MTVPEVELRAWARGLYPLEAAVEMLIRGFNGRFSREGCPWLETPAVGADSYWVDWDRLASGLGVLSGGEQRFLSIVLSLASDDYPVDLSNALAGLDRDLISLVLAGVSHAAGAHAQPLTRTWTAKDTATSQASEAAWPASERTQVTYPWPD